jgi:hypothetical protein|tara:strand:- start:113 stop:268 length:156 start_codon:yes stop_codon:yes gene_type:complete
MVVIVQCHRDGEAKAEALVNKAAQSDNIGVIAKPYNIPKLISAMISNAAAE